jgi:hypothetical protein
MCYIRAVASIKFSSEAEAIDFFVALNNASRAVMGSPQFTSEAAAIDYFVVAQAAIRSGTAVCSIAPNALAANPALLYDSVSKGC